MYFINRNFAILTENNLDYGLNARSIVYKNNGFKKSIIIKLIHRMDCHKKPKNTFSA